MRGLAYEYLNRRALAELLFVDATGARVLSPVTAEAPDVGVFAKRPGELVVVRAPQLAAYTEAFDPPPAAPAVGSVSIDLVVRPGSAEHGARRVKLKLPRDPDPAHAQAADSLFQPVKIELLPTPQAQPTGLTAALRVTVRRSDDNRRIEGALVRLRPDGGLPQARAFTDVAGDALLLAPGVPLSSAGPGATVLPDVGAQLDAIVDQALVRFTGDADLDRLRADAGRGPLLIDPDDLEARLAASAITAISVRVQAGRARQAQLSWTPPP